jgi:MFS superfamily sulfate permease-like transporter
MQITNRIHFDNLRGDIFGGVTAAIVSLPLALAFGVASGSGAIAGLYGAVCVGFFAELFGGTPTLISEPTRPMTVVMTKVGIDILDWSFLKRAQKISLKGTLIMYGVMLLTVFVDLIVAVGVGVFIANILTIDRLSELQAQEVKTITEVKTPPHEDRADFAANQAVYPT